MTHSLFDHDAHITAVAQGDHHAYVSLYRHEAPRMLALAKKMLVRNTEAQDAVKDTFVLIWKHAESCNTSTTSARAWIYSIFRHRVMSTLREPGRIAPAVRDWVDQLPAHHVNAPDANPLYISIQRLESSLRRPLLMAYYHGYSYRQIAAHLGSTAEQVRHQIDLALQTIRKHRHS